MGAPIPEVESAALRERKEQRIESLILSIAVFFRLIEVSHLSANHRASHQFYEGDNTSRVYMRLYNHINPDETNEKNNSQ